MSRTIVASARSPVRWMMVALPCLWLTHSAWLPWVAAPLIVADSPAHPCQFVFLLGGDSEYDLAARWLASGEVGQVLYFADPPSRLVRHGVLPPGEIQFLNALEQRGVAAKSVLVVAFDRERDAGLQEEERFLAFLDRHPEALVRVTCAEFSSRWKSWRLDAQKQRIQLVVVPDRRFTAANWWRSREGVKAVLYGYFDLAWRLLRGDEKDLGETWDEKRFETELIERRQGELRAAKALNDLEAGDDE